MEILNWVMRLGVMAILLMYVYKQSGKVPWLAIIVILLWLTSEVLLWLLPAMLSR